MPADVLPETLVLGGGIGGLSAALSLARRGAGVPPFSSARRASPKWARESSWRRTQSAFLRQLDVLDEIMPNAVMPRRLVLADAVEGVS